MSELLIVGSEQDNTRLDRFLADQYEEYTRSFLQKLIDQGNVSINGISCLLYTSPSPRDRG